MRCGVVFSGFIYLHFIVWFSYYMHMHLYLLRSVLAWCGVGVVLRFELDSFRSNWTNLNVNFNLKNSLLQQHKNLANYSIQI